MKFRELQEKMRGVESVINMCGVEGADVPQKIREFRDLMRMTYPEGVARRRKLLEKEVPEPVLAAFRPVWDAFTADPHLKKVGVEIPPVKNTRYFQVF